jgi:colanic acid biosynthesis glycosyl transferase WcaI
VTLPRLWVVSELYYPEETSTGYFLTRIAEGLADRYDVQIVCSRPTYSERDVPVEWKETRRRTTIHRMRSTRFNKDKLLGRIANLVSFTVVGLLFCMRHISKGDRLLIVTNPPTLPPLVGMLSKWRRARSVLLVHDVYPEVLVATGHAVAGGRVDRLLRKITSWTYGLYDDVVVLGRDMAEVARPKLANSSTRLHIVPNWGDVDEIAPIARDTNAFRQQHGFGDRAVVQFSGNLGRTHDIESVLNAAEIVGSQGPLFCFVGYGGKTALLDRFRIDGGDGNIRFLPRQPRAALNAMLTSADATVIAFVDQMYGVSVPSRMYNIMAAGVPIIAMSHPASELAQVVTEEGCGWVIEPSDAQGLSDIARNLVTIDGARDAQRRGKRGREAVIRRFTLPIVLRAFGDILDAPAPAP